MTGNKFIMTSDLFKGEIIFEYNLKGFLIGFKLNVSNIKMETLNWIYQNIPGTEKQINEWIKSGKNFKVEEIPLDLTFERFWTEYGQKVGKKTMTENAWKKLSHKDKISALLYIKKLQEAKKKDGTSMPYPSTYLNQKYWEV